MTLLNRIGAQMSLSSSEIGAVDRRRKQRRRRDAVVFYSLVVVAAGLVLSLWHVNRLHHELTELRALADVTRQEQIARTKLIGLDALYVQNDPAVFEKY